MRVLVCGSRTATKKHVDVIFRELDDLPADTTIVHGAAAGVDNMAAGIAKGLGLRVEAHPAQWDLYGRSAGPRRNREMLDSGVDLVIAFWNGSSPGTRDTIREAERRGIPVKVIWI